MLNEEDKDMSENTHHTGMTTSRKALIWIEFVTFGSLLAYFVFEMVKHVAVVYLGIGGR